MRNLCVVSILILVFCAASFAQTNQTAPCPNISITGPASLIAPGDIAVFTANGAVNDESLSYVWTVSVGTIIEGQNSPVINVSTTQEMEGSEIVATVEVKGLPDNCTKTASISDSVGYVCKLPLTLDDYEKIPLQDEKARLKNVADTLIKQPEMTAMFITYFPKTKSQLAKNRIDAISNYLTQTLKIPKDRITFVIAESEMQRTRIMLFPTEAIKNNLSN